MTLRDIPPERRGQVPALSSYSARTVRRIGHPVLVAASDCRAAGLDFKSRREGRGHP